MFTEQYADDYITNYSLQTANVLTPYKIYRYNDEYYRYLQDNEIIVNRLPSETPKGYGPPWQSKLEKILVDVSVDKIVSEIVPNVEKQVIFENAFHDYLIDVNMMIHYANRKRAKKKIVQMLKEHGRMA